MLLHNTLFWSLFWQGFEEEIIVIVRFPNVLGKMQHLIAC